MDSSDVHTQSFETYNVKPNYLINDLINELEISWSTSGLTLAHKIQFIYGPKSKHFDKAGLRQNFLKK